MKVFAVDAGKGQIKYAYTDPDGEVKTDLFETKMTKIEEFNDNDIVGSKTFLVEFQGNKYILGAQGENDSLHERTKLSDIHKIGSYVALAQMISKDDKSVIVMSNIPADSYHSTDIKKRYQDFYMSDNDVDITVNGVKHGFEIDIVHILPETAGFKFFHPELCSRGKVCVIDIGKYNIGIMVCVNGAIDSLISLDYGGKDLEELAIKLLEAKLDKGVNQKDIVGYLSKGFIEKWGEEVPGTREAITLAKQKYLDSINKKVAKREIQLENMDSIYFIGGTSKPLEDTVNEHENFSKTATVMENGEFVNVVGNLLYGERKYNGRK